MDFTYDPAKNAANIAVRGLSFDAVAGFDWDTALVVEDTRYVYPETRFQALGSIGKRLYMVVYTPQADTVRIISMRKANEREVRKYAEATR